MDSFITRIKQKLPPAFQETIAFTKRSSISWKEGDDKKTRLKNALFIAPLKALESLGRLTIALTGSHTYLHSIKADYKKNIKDISIKSFEDLSKKENLKKITLFALRTLAKTALVVAWNTALVYGGAKIALAAGASGATATALSKMIPAITQVAYSAISTSVAKYSCILAGVYYVYQVYNFLFNNSDSVNLQAEDENFAPVSR